MSDMTKVEGAESEAALTAVSNEQIASHIGDTLSVVANTGDIEVKVEQNETNGVKSKDIEDKIGQNKTNGTRSGEQVAGVDKNGVKTKEDASRHKGDSRRESTRGQSHYQRRPNNSKFDPRVVEVSDDPEKIRYQVCLTNL